MSLKIEVFIPQEHIEGKFASAYLAAAMAAIGFTRGVSLPMPAAAPTAGCAAALAPTSNATEALKEMAEPIPDGEQTDDAPKRERGKPSPGAKRRTKEEIAEDEAADAEDAKPLISSGEERVDPAQDAQDAADEAADPANASEGPELSRDNVRAAMVAYQTDFGAEVLMRDLKVIFTDNWPAGDVTKLSEIPGSHDSFKAVIDGLTELRTKREGK